MKLIFTTATAAEKLKRLAKQQRQASGTSLAAALDNAARTHGYASWKHVAQCLEQSKAILRHDKALPGVLAAYLDRAATQEPVSADVRAAFEGGLAFAMDVKDLDDVPLGPELVGCDEAWMLAAADMWNVFVHSKDHDADIPLADELDAAELLEAAQDELMNYRLVRYTAADVPTSLDDAFARAMGRFVFPPRYVWLHGNFIDMTKVDEVRVAGKVRYASEKSREGGLFSTYAAPGPATTESPTSAEVIDFPKRRAGIIPRLDIIKLKPGLYEYRMSHGGHEFMNDAGFASIREAVAAAADITGDIRGFEVRYEGLTVGTYPLALLQDSAESVAQQAVETLASLGDH